MMLIMQYYIQNHLVLHLVSFYFLFFIFYFLFFIFYFLLSLGLGFDLHINLLKTNKSFSNLGYSYSIPNEIDLFNNEANTLLAGSPTNWKFIDIEVYNSCPNYQIYQASPKRKNK